MSNKKKTKSPRLEDYLHKKPEKWTNENMRKFIGFSVCMAFIPAYLYWTCYDYRPDSWVGFQLIIYLITIGATAWCLLSTYIQIHINSVHFLNRSSQKKSSEKLTKLINAQSKSWSLFYVNLMFIGLFFLSNFYMFKTYISDSTIRYMLTSIGPAAIGHILNNTNNESTESK